MKKSEAKSLLQQARTAWDAEEWAESADLYERVLAHFPDEKTSPVWWYDAALAHKFLRDWPKAYALGREAAARSPRGEGDPAYWNLGIAATILREWAVARDAWEGFGITLPAGEGQIDGRFGMGLIRLDTDGEREVVWAERLCPTRARVVNVPVTSGRRWGEIVLHDGEPTGERIVDGNAYSVFDELLLFEPSELPTLAVTVNASEAADLEALTELFLQEGYGAEPASSVNVLCACCSEGSHEQSRTVHAGAQQVSLAAPEDEARRLLDAWSGETVIGRSWSGLQPMW
ncbi:tetratricopeptide repeat protein [Streptomyces sp. NBC_01465]|uniref:tetratricopeptide repeat protein n=1 Tax=Streptomyces sp. NBC_01465 TaxID=2903878 RepID=UPI002E3611FB|nr:tetratricopeptide repeat protein [Streptomyces sp. NBC_01465]